MMIPVVGPPFVPARAHRCLHRVVVLIADDTSRPVSQVPARGGRQRPASSARSFATSRSSRRARVASVAAVMSGCSIE